MKIVLNNMVIMNGKHFVNNNQEYNRFSVVEVVDERTQWELYMPVFQAAVDADDLPAAHRQLSKNCKAAKLLRRGLIGIKKAETLQISKDEPEKAAVYDALNDLNAMIAHAIQGKIAFLFLPEVRVP